MCDRIGSVLLCDRISHWQFDWWFPLSDIENTIRDARAIPRGIGGYYYELLHKLIAEVERLHAGLHNIADNANNEPYAADYARDLLKGEVDANKP